MLLYNIGVAAKLANMRQGERTDLELQDICPEVLKRRHLNETQRASVAAKLANLSNGQKASSANLQSTAVTQTQAADVLLSRYWSPRGHVVHFGNNTYIKNHASI